MWSHDSYAIISSLAFRLVETDYLVFAKTLLTLVCVVSQVSLVIIDLARAFVWTVDDRNMWK